MARAFSWVSPCRSIGSYRCCGCARQNLRALTRCDRIASLPTTLLRSGGYENILNSQALSCGKLITLGAEAMSLEEQLKFGEVVFAEPQQDVRVIVSVPGRYSLADKRNARGERRVFACRAVYLSSREIGLAGPVNGKVGERVIAHIDHLGKLEGPITRLIKGGFMMKIAVSGEKRSELAAKIEWLESFKNHDVPNRRAGDRIVPANPYSKLTFADGRVETCLVVDLSVSGAAISADSVPDIRTVLAVGAVVGRVVRHFVGGFAVQFIEHQNRDTVEAMVIDE
jgi:hypothetical protein